MRRYVPLFFALACLFGCSRDLVVHVGYPTPGAAPATPIIGPESKPTPGATPTPEHRLGANPFALPIGPAGGGLGGTFPNPTIAFGTAGQFLLTNPGATAALWATCSGDLSCSTATAGQLNVTKLASLAGGTITVGDGSHAVGFTMASAASGAGQTFTFTGSPATTSGATGSYVFNFGAPASGTVEGGLAVQRGGTTVVAAQALVGNATSGALYLGLGSTTLSGTNFTLSSLASGNTVLNGPSAGQVIIGAGGTILAAFNTGSITLSEVPVATVQYSTSFTASAVAAGGNQFSTAVGPVSTTGTTHSTQARVLGNFVDQVTLTHGAAATTISTIPQATSSTTGTYEIDVECRATTLFTGGAVGDSWHTKASFTVRNVAGTLTQVGTTTALATHTDTSVTSTALSLSLSTTNILVQLTPPAVAAGVADCTDHVTSLVN